MNATAYRPGRPWARLPEFIRAKVLEKQHDLNVDHDWWDFTYEDAERLLCMLGFYDIKISFSGFWSQGDGAQFTGRWKSVLCEPLKVKEEVGSEDDWQGFADRFSVLLIRARLVEHTLPTFTIASNGNYSHEGCTSFDFDYDGDETAYDAGDDEQELIDLSRDMMGHIYATLEQEHDYLSSEEQIVESIEANDYHFNFEGDII